MEPDAVEIRTVGCLIEKQRTTPDAYPLTLNSVRLACNQSTNRDPVVDYDERTILEALERLGRRGWVRFATWSSRQAMKYRHILDSALGLSDPERALLCVLMLRGPQTPGELKQRTERLHEFASLDEVEGTLRKLIERELAARLPRRPGQREERYVQLLGGGDREQAAASAAPSPAAAPPASAGESSAGATPVPRQDPVAAGGSAGTLGDRVARLEAEIASLRADLQALRSELGA
jgi:uncharacterized protein YceH (UPF0502 family)